MYKPKNHTIALNRMMHMFQKFLQPFGLTSVQQYLEIQGLSNMKEISKHQFLSIIEPLQLKLQQSTQKMNSLLMEIDDRPGYLSLTKFISTYNQILGKKSSQSSKLDHSSPQQISTFSQEPITRNQHQKQSKGSYFQSFAAQIQAYFKSNGNNGLNLFQAFDEHGSGKLKPEQFNQLLFATGIPKFQKAEIRKRFLLDVYEDIPSKQLTKEKYMQLFRIKYKGFKNQDPFVAMKINAFLQSKKLQFKKNKKIQQAEPRQAQKIIQPAEFLPAEFLPAEFLPVEFQPQNKRILQIKQMFPNASQYYLHEQPTEDDLIYLEELQYYLKKNKIFKDDNNPYTRKGFFVEANQLFPGSKYKLFEMAVSVIHREKSRIGMAQLIEPKDIMQGDIGDCYFLSALAALVSTNWKIIYDNFLFKENPANYFVVKMFFNGQWMYIKTDDRFPAIESGKDFAPCYAKPHGKKIWVMLIEKCWAKCFHSYQRINGGWAEEVFTALTGAPTQCIRWGNLQFMKQSVLWQLKQAYQLGHIISTSGSYHLNYQLSTLEKEIIGLLQGHAYSFLKFIDFDGTQLIKLRNPWGKVVWKGDWSFDSKKWTQPLRNKFNYNQSPEDGSFYMNMKDFLKYFDNFEICKINPTNVNTSFKMTFLKNKPNSIKIKATQNGRYSLSLYQGNKRQMGIKDQTIKYSPAKIVITKLGIPQQQIGSQQQKSSYATTVEVNLEKGSQYLVKGVFAWIEWQRFQGCVTTYGPGKVVFENIDASKPQEIKKEAMIGFYRQKIQREIQVNKIPTGNLFAQVSLFQDSQVICSSDEKSFIRGFFSNKKIRKSQLLYRASENEFSSHKFHAKCGGIANTLTVVWTQFDKKIGGFTPLKWKSVQAGIHIKTSDRHLIDNTKESFTFSLSNNDKFTLKKPQFAICNHADYGPAFGQWGLNLYVYDKGHIESKNGAQFNELYQNTKYQKGRREDKVRFCGDPGNPYAWYHPGNAVNFRVKEWQVWGLDFE